MHGAIRALTSIGFVMVLSCTVNAQEVTKDCSKVEVNRERILGDDGAISSNDEALRYSLHKNNELFRCFDTNYNGKIDGSEGAEVLGYLNNKIPESRNVEKDRTTYRQRLVAGDPFTIAELKNREKEPKIRPDKGFYIANSKFDLQSYSGGQRKKMKGASISFQDNQETGVKTGKLKGTIGYRFDLSNYRGSTEIEQAATNSGTTEFYDLFLAPRVSFDGDINTTQNEKSTLIAALDTGLHLNGVGGFNHQYFLISPYYQTDFRFEAQAYGAEVAWEPYLLKWRLGGFYPRRTTAPNILDGYWRLNLIADALSVKEAGKTDLTSGSEYVWLGGTIAGYWFPYHSYFSDKPISPFGIAKFSYFWDAVSGEDVELYEATLGLNLNEEGTTAVTLGYIYGQDKSDLVQKNEFNLGFNIKY